MAVAVFKGKVEGEVVVSDCKDGIKIKAIFTKLPMGKHGFHIHKQGDLRGEGCLGLCEHYDIGNNDHGSYSAKEKHTGDLGNIELKNGKFKKQYHIKGIKSENLWGRSVIVHEGEDDLGKGGFEDSKVTGHSGKRMACAIFGRTKCKTRKKH